MKILSMFLIGIIALGLAMAILKNLRSQISKGPEEKKIFHFKSVPEGNTETQRDME